MPWAASLIPPAPGPPPRSRDRPRPRARGAGGPLPASQAAVEDREPARPAHAPGRQQGGGAGGAERRADQPRRPRPTRSARPRRPWRRRPHVDTIVVTPRPSWRPKPDPVHPAAVADQPAPRSPAAARWAARRPARPGRRRSRPATAAPRSQSRSRRVSPRPEPARQRRAQHRPAAPAVTAGQREGQVTVTHHRAFRPDSPSRVMLPEHRLSSRRPRRAQAGDDRERHARRPAAGTGATLARSRRVQAGMLRPDAGGRQLALDAQLARATRAAGVAARPATASPSSESHLGQALGRALAGRARRVAVDAARSRGSPARR